MIYINNFTASTIDLTLYETTTLTGSPINYVLKLHSNLIQNDNYYILTGDTSLNPYRYNQYNIDVTSTLSGHTETFDYSVYQILGTSYQVSGLTDNNIVETGLAQLIPSGTTQTPSFTSNNQEYFFN
jgi:hypothetical protein